MFTNLYSKGRGKSLLIVAAILTNITSSFSGEKYDLMTTSSEIGNHTYYALGEGMVTIDNFSETLFIDYEVGILHRYTKRSGLCQNYSLSADGMHPVTAVQAKMLSEASVVNGEGKENSEEIKTVVFGARVMAMRRAVDTSLEALGTRFTPGRVDFAISHQYKSLEKIQEIAGKHRAIKGLNPLLDRIDASRLVFLFDGVILETRARSNISRISYTFEDRESQLPARQRLCGGAL